MIAARKSLNDLIKFLKRNNCTDALDAIAANRKTLEEKLPVASIRPLIESLKNIKNKYA